MMKKRLCHVQTNNKLLHPRKMASVGESVIEALEMSEEQDLELFPVPLVGSTVPKKPSVSEYHEGTTRGAKYGKYKKTSRSYPPRQNGPYRAKGSNQPKASSNYNIRNYKVEQRNSSDVKRVGITSRTVDAFRDLAPSHVDGLRLHKIFEIRDGDKLCVQCGETGHVAQQCSTWKTVQCRQDETGKCSYGKSCRFSHRGDTVRNPASVFCNQVRVFQGIARDTRIVMILGCQSKRHHIDDCPFSTCLLCGSGHHQRFCTLNPHTTEAIDNQKNSCEQEQSDIPEEEGNYQNYQSVTEYAPESPSYTPAYE
jgi:hypothetical protein